MSRDEEGGTAAQPFLKLQAERLCDEASGLVGSILEMPEDEFDRAAGNLLARWDANAQARELRRDKTL